MFNKYIVPTLSIIAIVAAVMAFVAVGGIAKQKSFGAASNMDVISGASLQIGSGCDDSYGTCTGTAISRIKTGTCTLVTTQLPLAATTSIRFTCSASGVASGDKVFGSLATTSAVVGGFNVQSLTAITDSIQVSLFNQTGASTSSFPAATTSFQWWAVR